MLNKDRQSILDKIRDRMENDLNNVNDFTNVPMDNGDWWGQQYINSGQYSGPNEMIGWPSGLPRYIRRLSLMMAYEILDSIYTEQELDIKAEDILLDNEPTETDSK